MQTGTTPSRRARTLAVAATREAEYLPRLWLAAMSTGSLLIAAMWHILLG